MRSLIRTEGAIVAKEIAKARHGFGTPSRSATGWEISPEIRAQVAQLTATSFFISVGVTLTNWALLVGVLWTAQHLRGLLLLIYPALWLVACRALRAFENLTHEASHYNWSRKHRHLNDRVADWLCARWVGLSVSSYRRTHTRHHANFNSPTDPCRLRYQSLQLDFLDRSDPIQFMSRLFRQIVPYMRDYWQAYYEKKESQILVTGALHGTIMAMGTWLLEPGFWKYWLAGVIFPFVAILPWLRLWAEASEHRYSSLSEFESTYNNRGMMDRWFIHPVSDAWHLTHHLVPSIPHHKLARADGFFRRRHACYAAHGKVRVGLFDEPDRLRIFYNNQDHKSRTDADCSD